MVQVLYGLNDVPKVDLSEEKGHVCLYTLLLSNCNGMRLLYWEASCRSYMHRDVAPEFLGITLIQIKSQS
jgi:hypothetical protein